MVSAKKNCGSMETMWHFNQVGSRQGCGSLKVVAGRKS